MVGTQVWSRVTSWGQGDPTGGAKVAEAMGQLGSLGVPPLAPQGWVLGPSPSFSVPS